MCKSFWPSSIMLTSWPMSMSYSSSTITSSSKSSGSSNCNSMSSTSPILTTSSSLPCVWSSVISASSSCWEISSKFCEADCSLSETESGVCTVHSNGWIETSVRDLFGEDSLPKSLSHSSLLRLREVRPTSDVEEIPTRVSWLTSTISYLQLRHRWPWQRTNG